MKILLVFIFGSSVFHSETAIHDRDDRIPTKILKHYWPVINCLLGRESCTPVSEFLAVALPDFLRNQLDNYDYKDKVLLKTHSRNIRKYFPHEWELIEKKFHKRSKYNLSVNSISSADYKIDYLRKEQGEKNDEFSRLAAESFVSNNFTNMVKLYKDLITDLVVYGDCLICNKNSLKWLNDIKNYLQTNYPRELREIVMKNKNR
ncbi:uncharacterized protein LOC123258454 [Cotesia glomerata]|uniref:Uncharacterized protein n=1 Tax=Cotesia glomerata TaxID=32391 RepID=A0AAV7HGH8_COTGL|nr:uncharacterized protein LOC123258454 [Cotesia glomerata]KAH0539236.1 hypothetical protein KQX54_002793 [Cotesia glomerata]